GRGGAAHPARRHRGVPGRGGVVEIRRLRRRRSRRGAPARRALRPAPWAHAPSTRGGPDGRAGGARPVGRRGLHAPRLPVLAATARPPLGGATGRLMAHRAVILLSGGLDSTTTLAIARAEGYDCYALSFDYGQRHPAQPRAARPRAAAV